MASQFTNPFTNPGGFFSSQEGGFLAPPKREGFEGFLSDPRLSIGMAIAQGQPIGQALLGGAIQSKQIEKSFFPDEERDIKIINNQAVDFTNPDKPVVLGDYGTSSSKLTMANQTTDYKNYLNTDPTPTPEEFKVYLDRNQTKTENIKTVNNQIIDYTDLENPKIIFDGRDESGIKTQIVDGQVIITNTETGISSAKPIEGFVKDTSEKQSKKIEFYNKQYTNNTVTKNFNTATTQVSKLFASAKDPSAAGDLAMIFTYMKILDPTSVVREGEQATAQNATGVDDRTRNLFNRLLTGERLTLEQRDDFVKKGIALYQSNQLSLDRFKSSYQDSFIGDGIKPSSIFTDSDFRPKKIELDGKTINVPKGTLLINYDPTKDSYIYQMPDGTKFQVGRQNIL